MPHEIQRIALYFADWKNFQERGIRFRSKDHKYGKAQLIRRSVINKNKLLKYLEGGVKYVLKKS